MQSHVKNEILLEIVVLLFSLFLFLLPIFTYFLKIFLLQRPPPLWHGLHHICLFSHKFSFMWNSSICTAGPSPQRCLKRAETLPDMWHINWWYHWWKHRTLHLSRFQCPLFEILNNMALKQTTNQLYHVCFSWEWHITGPGPCNLGLRETRCDTTLDSLAVTFTQDYIFLWKDGDGRKVTTFKPKNIMLMS